MSNATASPADSRTTTERTEWTQLDLALSSFERFLASCANREQLKDWHVVFSLGTVVRVEPGAPELTAYTSERERGQHRWLGEQHERQQERLNAEVVGAQLDEPGEAGAALRRAYRRLFDDGYPTPGNPGSDRTPVPLEHVADPAEPRGWLIVWHNRDVFVSNLGYAASAAQACAEAGECRRVDLMEPRAVAVISPSLVLTRLDEQ